MVGLLFAGRVLSHNTRCMAARRKRAIDQGAVSLLAQYLTILAKHLEACATKMGELNIPSVEAEISTAQNQAIETITMAIARIEAAISAVELTRKMNGQASDDSAG